MTMCSCGDRTDHEIARRTLATGQQIVFWSDGTVTWSDVGRTMVRGLGRARGRYGRGADLRALHAIIDIAESLDASELVPAARAARAFVRKGGAWDDERKRLHEAIYRALGDQTT